MKYQTVDLTMGDVDSVMGEVVPTAGDVDSVTGEVVPWTGDVVPSTVMTFQ